MLCWAECGLLSIRKRGLREVVLWPSSFELLFCLRFSDNFNFLSFHNTVRGNVTAKLDQVHGQKQHSAGFQFELQACSPCLVVRIMEDRREVRVGRTSVAAVPNLFGPRDVFRGRQFFHGLGWEGWFSGWFKFTSCCVSWFLMGPDHYGSLAQRLGTPAL